MWALGRLAQSFKLARVAALLVVMGVCAAAASAPASAARVSFGADESLRKIQDVDVKGPKGEALYLGHKVSHHSFGVPYRVTDDGYILGVVGEPRRYYPLDAATIERLQAQRLLPSPLPTYSLSILDQLMGNLLWLVLAGIGAFILLSWRAQRRRKLAVPFAQAGLAHHRAGNLNAAIAEYGKALERDPKLADALMLRGDAYRAQGDVDRAIADYSKIIKSDPKTAVALVARGAAFEAKGLVQQAMDDYTRAIKSSKAAVAYFMRGNVYLRRDDPATAINDYTSAIERHTDFAAAYQSRAAAYERTGKPDLAQADRQAAARIATASGAAQLV